MSCHSEIHITPNAGRSSGCETKNCLAQYDGLELSSVLLVSSPTRPTGIIPTLSVIGFDFPCCDGYLLVEA